MNSIGRERQAAHGAQQLIQNGREHKQQRLQEFEGVVQLDSLFEFVFGSRNVEHALRVAERETAQMDACFTKALRESDFRKLRESGERADAPALKSFDELRRNFRNCG